MAEDEIKGWENIPAGVVGFPKDVHFCSYCSKPHTTVRDMVQHIAIEHKSEPIAPEDMVE